jgi:hypothetical protein
VQLVLEHQGPVVTWTVNERIEVPAVLDSTELEEETRIRILPGLGMVGARQQASLGIALGEMKPALLECAAVRTENRFERKGRGSGERVLLDPDRIVHTIEFDRLSERGIDNSGITFDSGLDTADVVQSVEGPHDFAGGLLGDEHGRRAHDEQGEHGACCGFEDHPASPDRVSGSLTCATLRIPFNLLDLSQ